MIEYKGCEIAVAKLTEWECWRLMGWGYRDENGVWHDDDFKKAAAKVSRSQLYKQAGNGIITNCIAEIVKKMFPDGLDKPLKLIELFGGIGCQMKGIKMAGIPVESHFYCDFDKYATMSFNAINGTNYEPTDIKNIRGGDLNIHNTDEEVYLLTYSFPCTDLSCAGKMAGMSKNAEVQTRSGLLWEVERILTEIVESGGELPNYLLLENVPQLHGKRNIADFEQWIAFLESIGYHSKWTDINGVDVGIPQNRKRCFMVSSLKPLDDFEWPEKIELTTCMADYLDEERDEKYYVKNERSDNMIMDLIERGELDKYIDEMEETYVFNDGTIEE